MPVEHSVNSSFPFEHDTKVVLVGTFRLESLFAADTDSIINQELKRLDTLSSVNFNEFIFE